MPEIFNMLNMLNMWTRDEYSQHTGHVQLVQAASKLQLPGCVHGYIHWHILDISVAMAMHTLMLLSMYIHRHPCI